MPNISEAWVDFVAGWCSGAMAVVVCQPVDTILTRLQAGPKNLVLGGATATATAAAAASATTTTITTTSATLLQTQHLVSHHGVKALWRGSSAMITAVPIQNALLMGGYGIGKKWAEQHNQNQQQQQQQHAADTTSSTTTTTLLSVFVGGCTGGIIQSFLMSPVELIKVNQQVIGQSTRVAGREVVQGLWMFLRTNGTSKQSSLSSSSSWRGLNATLLRDGIPHGVWFASYEWCKTVLGEYLECADNKNNNINSSSRSSSSSSSTGNTNSKYHAQMTVPLVSGAFAATVAWVSVNFWVD
jgi:solute carrier family 25 (mitochondrial carnitine/acylcarnitine transporter), member 20/29